MGVQAKSAREKEVAFLRANPPKSKTKYADQNNDFTFHFLSSLINHKSKKDFLCSPAFGNYYWKRQALTETKSPLKIYYSALL